MLRLGRLPDPSGDGSIFIAAHRPERAGVGGKASVAEAARKSTTLGVWKMRRGRWKIGAEWLAFLAG